MSPNAGHAVQLSQAFAAIEEAVADGYTEIKLTVREWINQGPNGQTRELRVDLELERTFEAPS